MADDSLIFVRERNLDFPVFDADNHMYENTDAFTKFLPPEYEGVVKYIDEGNRSKIAIKDRIDRAIPNPTFVRVAPPGGQQDDPLHRRSISGLDAFFDVEPRFKLMQEFGISGALMWPTLASVIEQAMPDDPKAVQVVFHALNQWMYEHWTFGYENAVFPTPAISLGVLDKAIEELEWVAERGAAHRLPRHRARERVRWAALDRAARVRPVLGGHAGEGHRRRPPSGGEPSLSRGSPRARRHPRGGWLLPAAVRGHGRPRLATPRWQIADFVASMIGHGMLTRFPGLKVAIVEFFTDWMRPMINQFQIAYEKSPQLFDEDPMVVLRRNVFLHLFHDPNPVELISMIGVENCMFGSDFPHPEGLRDPLAFSEEITSLPFEDQRRVMGGNLARLMKVG